MREFDEPLVATLGIVVHINRCGSIFQHLGASLLAGVSQALFGIVLHELFAKGIDEIFGTTGDYKLVWVATGEANGVANDVAPQATRGRNDHGVVFAELDA